MIPGQFEIGLAVFKQEGDTDLLSTMLLQNQDDDAMKQAARSQSHHPHQRPANESDRQTPQTRVTALVDTRPKAIAQRKLADAIHHSPYVVTQRQQLRGMFGKAAQLSSGREDEELLQAKRDSLDGPIQGVFVNADGDRILSDATKAAILREGWQDDNIKDSFITTFTSANAVPLDDWAEAQPEAVYENKKLNEVLTSDNEEAWEFPPEESPESIKNEMRNVENQIRTAAQRVLTKDNSGHGGGKTIPKGSKGDSHEKGQRRKDTRKAALNGTLQQILEHYAELGGDGTTLEPTTRKLLKKAGWKVPKEI